MQSNLEVCHFNNGDSIPEARSAYEWKEAGDNKKPAWCYYDYYPANGKVYGKLYNWYAVSDPRGINPLGWHIPAEEDWERMISLLSGKFEAGAKMKNKEGWEAWKDPSVVNNNESGFSALPAGSCDYRGKSSYLKMLGYWWTSSTGKGTDPNKIIVYLLSYNRNTIDQPNTFNGFKSTGFSVRLMKD